MQSSIRTSAIVTIATALLAGNAGLLHSQEAAADPPPADAAFEFTGLSDERSFDVALRDALRQMDEAVAKYGKYPCTAATWRVVEISGETGGPADVNTLAVRITATFETREVDPVGGVDPTTHEEITDRKSVRCTHRAKMRSARARSTHHRILVIEQIPRRSSFSMRPAARLHIASCTRTE